MNKTYQLSSEVIIKNEENNAYVFDVVKDKLFKLNATGLFIIEQLQKNQKAQTKQILEKIHNKFQDPVEEDILSFIDTLEQNGIISQV